jgi:glycolate oxidase FAD binding subunit
VDSPTCLIDDFGPVPVVRPASVPEIGDIVRRAAADGLGLYPLGGRTMLDLGLPPTRPGLGVDLTALADVIDYPARDMTVTVRAGITLAALQNLLATEKQRLPVDVPQADRATLGGALAANVSGPRRHGFGTLRDFVIGISTFNDEGQETKAGGRVVKNVAGYDLCKLHVGALGTLGIISQVTLKVRPIPEATALLTLGCEASDLGPLLDRLHTSRTRPVCVDALNVVAARAVAAASGAALPEAPWVVVVGYEDRAETVNWQVQQLLTEVAVARVRGVEARAGSAAERLWQALVEFTNPVDARVSFKANLLAGATASFCQTAEELNRGIALQAHAGSGIVRGHLIDDVTQEQATGMVRPWQAAAVTARGTVVLTRCPAAWKAALPVWGMPRGDWPLMRRVKEMLDPRRLFNPGRFVDGI